MTWASTEHSSFISRKRQGRAAGLKILLSYTTWAKHSTKTSASNQSQGRNRYFPDNRSRKHPKEIFLSLIAAVNCEVSQNIKYNGRVLVVPHELIWQFIYHAEWLHHLFRALWGCWNMSMITGIFWKSTSDVCSWFWESLQWKVSVSSCAPQHFWLHFYKFWVFLKMFFGLALGCSKQNQFHFFFPPSKCLFEQAWHFLAM